MDASNPPNLRRSSRVGPAHRLLPAPELERGEMHVFCLPKEIITYVFGLLPVQDLGQVARVCAGWRDLAYQKSLWRDVTFPLTRQMDDLDGAELQLLLDSLLLRGIQNIVTGDHNVLREVTQHLSHLRSATFRNCLQVPMSWSCSLVQQMSNLTELSFMNGYVVTDMAIQLIAENLKKLVTLKVDDCKKVTSSSMKYIAMGLPELKNLHLAYSKQIGDLGIGYLCGIGLNHPPRLQLKYINLIISESFSDLTIQYLSTGQLYIQKLHLYHLLNLSDTVFQSLAKMRKLHHLRIKATHLTGSGLIYLANANSPITYLDLSNSEYLTDQALEHVGQLKQLRTLILKDTNTSDDGLEQLVKSGGSPISTLNLRECHRITSEAMRHVSQLRQLHQLDYLVHDVGLAHLADGQSPVAIIECSDDITEVGLSHVARLNNLQSLNLSSCRHITGAALREFVANVRGQLTELRLCHGSFPYKYYEKGLLVDVARRFPNLTQLHLQGRFKKEMVDAASLLPRLHSLFLKKENIIEQVRSEFEGHIFQ